MKAFLNALILFLMFFGTMLMERYTAEKDVVRQLLTEGRTHFIFLDDIKITGIEKVKEEK